MNVIIRGIKSDEICKLDQLASEKNISRSEYLRRLIRIHLMAGELKSMENKYENLVQMLAEIVQNNSDKMEELTRYIQKMGEENGKKDF